jgi:hypothetical protein
MRSRTESRYTSPGGKAGVDLPADLAAGDLVAVGATGAYTHAMASNYNRLPRPAMVLVGDGHAQLLVRRETLDDVLARDQLLPVADLHSVAMESTDDAPPDHAP